jgi:hypothetical protein
VINGRRLLTVISLLVLSLLVRQGTAQTVMEAHASIPFEFWVEGNHVPAGNYQIEQIASIPYVLFLNTDGNIAAGAYTIGIDKNPTKDSEARLIFRIQDGRHFLYGGWGLYGKHVLRAESKLAVPSGDNRVEVPVSFH